MTGRRASFLLCAFWCAASAARAAADYPLTLTAEAMVNSAATTITSSVTIRVDRLMEENRRKRVTDALTHGGYANFVTALRSLPAVGVIELDRRTVDVRYAHESADATRRRLVLIADRPLFFLGDPEKSQAGYQLTVMELRFDENGGVTGTMAGAARVKPSAAGPVLDDYSGQPVRLTAHVGKP